MYRLYEPFVTYLFPHRAHELRSYRTHVLGLFSSRAPEFHSAVLQADIAMRSEVALRNDLALDDFQDLIFVWQRFVDARGSHASSSAATSSDSSTSRKKSRRNESSREFCIHWNKGNCTYKNCRHIHACNLCNNRSHNAVNHASASSSSGASAGDAVESSSRSGHRTVPSTIALPARCQEIYLSITDDWANDVFHAGDEVNFSGALVVGRHLSPVALSPSAQRQPV